MHSIKTTFATISLFILFVFACAAYIANAEELTPQQRFEAMQAKTEAARQEKQAELEARRAEFASTTEAKKAEMEQKREEMQQKMEDRKAEFASTTEARKEEMNERREERRAALTERAQQRVTNLAANISNRMEAAIGRLTQIADRMDIRIAKLRDAGVDTEAAESHMDDARAAISRALEGIDGIDDAIAAVTGSEDPKAAWANVRTTYAAVKADLMSARDALRAAVAVLKEAVRAAGYGSGVSEAVRQGDGSASTTEDADTETTE